MKMLTLLIVSLLFCYRGWSATFELQNQMTSPWVDDLYHSSVKEIQKSSAVGMCKELFARYSFEYENDLEHRDKMTYVKLAILTSRALMDDYVERNPDGVSRHSATVAKVEDELNAQVVNRFMDRIIRSDNLKTTILSHLDEFKEKKLFVHSDSIYQRRVESNGPILSNFVRFFMIVDLENKEMMVVGSGDCQF